MSTARLSALLTVACLALLAPAAQADVSGSDIVGFVNAQRAANGFPAGVTEDTAASAACARWAGGDPAATLPAEGWVNWYDSPLADNLGPWTAAHDPFEPNPAGLPLVLAPRLASFGAAEVGAKGCATLITPGTRPAPAQDTTYTYPGDGAQDTRTSQRLPATDQSDRRVVGALVYAFFDGPDFDPAHPATAKATSASLTGPDGVPLALDLRDASTSSSTASLPTEVQLVPRDALKPFTKYTASVAADVTLPSGGPTRAFARTWSFTTGGRENLIQLLGVDEFRPIHSDPSDVIVAFMNDAPNATATATGPGTPATASAPAPAAAYAAAIRMATLHLDRPGTWHICLQSGGAGTDYRPASLCVDASAGAVPKAAPKPLTPKPAKLVVSLGKGAKARWRGRTVSVPVRCSAKCSLRVAGTVRAGGKNIKLGTKRVTRKGAGTVTIKYTMSKATAARLRRAKVRRLALTIVSKGATTVRKTVAISAK